MRRAVDVVQRVALAVAIGFTVAAVPVAALAGASAQRAGDAIVRVENAAAHPSTALLLRDAPDTDQNAMLGSAITLGEWHTPAGLVRTGPVTVSPGASAGMTVPIWVDDAGRPVDPPLTEDQAYWRGVVTGVMVLIGLFALITAAFWATRWLLDRRRLAKWATDWRTVEPRWSRRE